MDLKGINKLLNEVETAPDTVKRLIFAGLTAQYANEGRAAASVRVRRAYRRHKKRRSLKAKKVYVRTYVSLDKIEKYIKEHGNASIKEIANDLGLTKSRAWYVTYKLLKRSPHIKVTRGTGKEKNFYYQ